jgi:catechol 2,3-dioxygenase-like lactoylglutathione lyase family enzyme
VGVRGIGHANLRAPAEVIEQLRRFYTAVVGLREGPRPQFRSGSQGYWLYAGDTDVLHLSIARDDAPLAASNGAFNHLAFACDDLAGTRARLDAAGIAYEVEVVDQLRQVQLFLTDPAGMGVELTFPDPSA